MPNFTLTISGDSQEVITVIRALAHNPTTIAPTGRPPSQHIQTGYIDTTAPTSDEPPNFSWSAETARDINDSISPDAKRLLDALLTASEHQLHIDDIYHDLELDRYSLIGARRSISAALRRNPATTNTYLLTTKDRRVSLDAGYARVMQVAATPDQTAPPTPLS